MSKKTKEELTKEVETKQRQAFVKAVQAVEEKHGYRVVAALNFSQSGVFPTLGVEKTQVEPEKVTPEKD